MTDTRGELGCESVSNRNPARFRIAQKVAVTCLPKGAVRCRRRGRGRPSFRSTGAWVDVKAAPSQCCEPSGPMLEWRAGKGRC
jgi:hypothetical protein